jgi:hypothetical protein
MAHGRSAGRVAIGAPAARALAGTRSAGGGVRVRPTRRGAGVYAVRGGRVQAVAAASRALARHPKDLRTAMRRVITAKASSRQKGFIPSAALEAAGAPTGRTLAGTSDPRLNAALTMLCSLQVSGR